MGTYYWFRVFMMVVSFVAVVWTIRTINSRGLGTAGKLFSPNPGDELSVTLCPTRVKSIQTSTVKIAERDMTWFREISETEEPEKLSPIAVEKWFSEYCTISGKAVAGDEPLTAAATLEFVSGPPEVLMTNPAGLFFWRGVQFSSEELKAALSALSSLPAASSTGH